MQNRSAVCVLCGSRPWLLEVNSAPSLSQDCVADEVVKPPLIEDLIGTARIVCVGIARVVCVGIARGVCVRPVRVTSVDIVVFVMGTVGVPTVAIVCVSLLLSCPWHYMASKCSYMASKCSVIVVGLAL